MKRGFIFLISIIILGSVSAAVVKYPYAMRPTTHSLRVLWQVSETDEPGTVYYGTDPQDLSLTVSSTTGKTIEGEGRVHYVDLTGLQPFTRYYYRVEGIDDTCSAKTAPEPGTAFRIFTISDIHENAKHNWGNMQTFICGLDCDLMMCNGDFINDGAGRDWDHSLFTPGRTFLSQTVLMSSAGNHETDDPLTYRWSTMFDYFWQFSHGEEDDPIRDPRGEGYFAYDYGNARIIAVDVNGGPAAPEHRKGSKQLAWFENELNTATQDWILVFGHVGLTTSGYHGQWPPEDRDAWRNLMETAVLKGKKVIYFCGDDHSFEHLYRKGIHYVRPGCGRDANYAQQTRLGDAWYTIRYNQVSCFSTLDMAADGNELHLTARTPDGEIFYEYTFHKHEGDTIFTPLRPVTAALTGEVRDNQCVLLWTYSAPQFKKVVVVRNEDHFPMNATDGVNVYEGEGTSVYDTTADIKKSYYYGTFTYDAVGSVSTPTADSRWQSPAKKEEDNKARKKVKDGLVYITKNEQTFSPLGIEVCK